MKFYYILFILVFSLSNNTIYSQSCERILKGGGGGISMKGTKSDLIEIFNYNNRVKSCLENITNKKDSAKLLRRLAGGLFSFTFTDWESTHHAPDSLVHIIEKAYMLDSTAFCREYLDLKKMGEKEMFNPFYLELLDNNEISELKAHCLIQYKSIPKKVVHDNFTNKAYRFALDSINILDQKYRNGQTDLPDEQDVLDEGNRNAVDSLYQIYGFPSREKVGQGCQRVFEVLLHSKNCSWNQKWGLLFLEHQKEAKINPGGVDWFFERFFDPKQGYCTLKDSIESKRYIFYLRKKESASIAKKYGYYSFYPKANYIYQICNEIYSYDHAIRNFSKKYVVDQAKITSHLSCLLNALKKSKDDIPIAALGHIYNEIAQDYDLLGNQAKCLEYIDKLAKCDLDLLKVLYASSLKMENKKHIKMYYLSFYKKALFDKYDL